VNNSRRAMTGFYAASKRGAGTFSLSITELTD
jgi:hypothetical protein